MSEIPEDVMADAEEIWGEAWAERWREDKQPPEPALIIAKAIMEEREACAKIAADIGSDLRNPDRARITAAKIADAIRSQTLAD